MRPTDFDRHLLRLFLLVALPFANARAQSGAQVSICDKHGISAVRCTELASEFDNDHRLQAAGAVSPLDYPLNNVKGFAYEIAPRAILATIGAGLSNEAKRAAQHALQTVSTGAAVTQAGAAASSSGSSNLVAKPTSSDLISIASESGAFTDTVNGTSATLQANALGLTKYLADRPVFQRWDDHAADYLQPLNLSVTLNIAQSSASSVSTSGNANVLAPANIAAVLLPSNNASFSSFGATYNVYRPYNPQSKVFLANWAAAVAHNSTQIATANAALSSAVNALLPGPDVPQVIAETAAPLSVWHTAALAAENAPQPDFNAFVAAYRTYNAAFCDSVMHLPGAAANATNLVEAVGSFDVAIDTVVNQARGTPLATVGYTFATPVQQPSTHSFTLAAAYLFKGNPNLQTGKGSFLSGAEFSTNFTAAIYATVPTGAVYGRLQDLQVSAEFDKPVGGTLAAPRATLSVAGYGQYQSSPSVLNITSANLAPGTNITLPANAQVLLGTAGWLSVVQGKLVLNLKSGLTIPVAVKWSNKTNLLQANDVRGQIGISYDLSALSSLIK